MWIYLILFWTLGPGEYIGFAAPGYRTTKRILSPGILGQCVDCNERWHHHCESKFTGYYCAGNKSLIRKEYLTNAEFATSTEYLFLGLDKCTPYPYVIGMISQESAYSLA